jgi:hypothetical protein
MAHLVPKLTIRREDAATDALAFILNNSPECRGALSLLLVDSGFHLESLTNFKTQVTHKDGSRPDMIGYDQEGRKRVIVESKFWAGLLRGQASGYFGQLEEAGSGLLLFVAPGLRLETLWDEIKRQMTTGKDGVQLEEMETPERIHKARIAGSNKRLMLVSWDLLLTRLATAVPRDSVAASDIRQLQGLCQREDDAAFQPIHAEELGPSLARRIRWFNRLIDDVVSKRGVRDGWMSVKGLRATPQKDGYGRYFRFKNASGNVNRGDLFLCVNFRLWATSGDTPLWLWIDSKVPIDVGRLRQSMPSLVDDTHNGTYDVPMYVTTGVEYGRVLADVVLQAKTVRDMVNFR